MERGLGCVGRQAGFTEIVLGRGSSGARNGGNGGGEG